MENQNHQQIRDTQEFTQDYDPGNPPVSIFCWATSIVTKITTFLGAYLLRKTEGQGKWHHSQWNQMWWAEPPNHSQPTAGSWCVFGLLSAHHWKTTWKEVRKRWCVLIKPQTTLGPSLFLSEFICSQIWTLNWNWLTSEGLYYLVDWGLFLPMGIPFHQAVFHWGSALTITFMAQLKKTRGLVCQTSQVSAHLEAKGTEGAVEKCTPHRRFWEFSLPFKNPV